jgi:hypothetical protein
MKTGPVCQCLYVGIMNLLPYFNQPDEKPSSIFTLQSLLEPTSFPGPI